MRPSRTSARLDILVNSSSHLTNSGRSMRSPNSSSITCRNIKILGRIPHHAGSAEASGRWRRASSTSVLRLHRLDAAGIDRSNRTKGALDAFTGVWARESRPRKIRVTASTRATVETEGNYTGGIIGSDFARRLSIAQAPLGCSAQVGDIAPIAVFLALDRFRVA